MLQKSAFGLVALIAAKARMLLPFFSAGHKRLGLVMKRHIHHISEIFWYNYFITKEIRLGNAKGLIHEYEERTTLDSGNFKNQGIVKLKKREKINIGKFNHPFNKKNANMSS